MPRRALIILSTLMILGFVSCQSKVEVVQKRVFFANKFEYSGYWESECRDACQKYSGGIDSHLRSGWRVVASSPNSIAEGDKCLCVGTEYIIEKIERR